MRRNLSLLFRLLRIQIRSQLQYPASFVMEVLSQAMILGFFFAAFALTLSQFGDIGGWTLGEVALLWGLAEFSFGMMDMVFSGFDYDAFGPLVIKGTFDQLLLRPVNITLQVLGSRFVLRRLGKIIEGLIIFIIGLSLSNVDWTLGRILYIPVLILCQVLFFGSLFIFGATTTFWTKERLEILNVFTYGGSEIMSYPMHIFPRAIRLLFSFVVPAIFLSYFPMIYILDKPNPLNMPVFTSFLAPFIAISMFWLSLKFWRFGIKNYQSTGS
ncbi:MAG: ABC-2 family transporter protein [Brevefilum sp.]|nr:ABC-2 family transporter protein [Brevefilum sp.]MDT8382052.1 ABC-2 family transporter protein [Brevefilum sp.]MDW7754139.1 ABC-2 family transporter protein [Brevefilum sp.]